MNQSIIAALQGEIAAAQLRLDKAFLDKGFYDEMGDEGYHWLRGYIDGLKTAVALLEKEPVKELPY